MKTVLGTLSRGTVIGLTGARPAYVSGPSDEDRESVVVGLGNGRLQAPAVDAEVEVDLYPWDLAQLYLDGQQVGSSGIAH